MGSPVAWLGAFLFVLTLEAQSDAGAAKSSGDAPSAPAEVRTSVLRATLDNGLRVVLVRNTLAPVVSTVVNYRVGSNEAPEDFPGTAHALEHMMFRGGPGLSRDQLSEIGAQIGGDFNADTTQTVTQFLFTAPAADLDVALRVEALRMRRLDVSEAGWAKERGAIEQEVSRDLSNPEYVFYSHLLAAMFKGTPYAHDALGTRPSFDKTSAARLKSFYRQWYAPNNAILVVVGDVDPDAMLADIKQLFGSIPKKTLPLRPTIKLQPITPITLHLTTDQPYGHAVVAYRMPGYSSPDYAAATILADALDSRRGSLDALAPEGKALSAGFEADTMPDAGLGFALGEFAKGADAEALLKEMNQRLAATRESGVPLEMVEAARRQEIAQLERQKNSVPGLANAWSTALAFQNLDSPDAMKAAFEAVTAADVNRVARELLDPEHAISAILTPQLSGNPISSKGYGGAESLASAPTKPVKLPDWAEQALSRVVVPQSSLNPVDTVLPNGLRLIVQRDAVSDTVSLYGGVHSNSDLEEPQGKDGVSEVLNRLFSYGGGGLDRVAFQTALDDIAAVERAGTRFNVQAPANQFERAVQLVADNELRPQLPEAAFKVVRSELAQAVAGRLQAPDYLFHRAVSKALLPADDPGLRQATPQTISALTLDDVHAYYQHVFRPDLTTVVVIGKVEPAEAERVVAKYFGDWKASGPKPDVDLSTVPANATSQALVPDSSSLQDSVVLAENVGVNLHDPDHYALQLGNQLLGEGFYASRLYRDLRARSGLVYTVDSRFHFARSRSTYTVRYGSDADNVDKARTIVLNDLRQMQAAPMSDTELSRAKAMVLRRIPLQNDDTGQIASSWLYYAENDLPLDQLTVAARHYADLSAAQVRQAYRKWLRPEAFAEVVKGPPPRGSTASEPRP
ncbi:MAG: pitrilysin family protein [Nevskia sp.]|nr:pitrilysin family protein [Nevskia sp.]